jgi:hypothetical protein
MFINFPLENCSRSCLSILFFQRVRGEKIECIGAQKVIIKSNAEERKPKVLTGNIFQFAFAAFVL